MILDQAEYMSSTKQKQKVVNTVFNLGLQHNTVDKFTPCDNKRTFLSFSAAHSRLGPTGKRENEIVLVALLKTTGNMWDTHYTCDSGGNCAFKRPPTVPALFNFTIQRLWNQQSLFNFCEHLILSPLHCCNVYVYGLWLMGNIGEVSAFFLTSQDDHLCRRRKGVSPL